MTRVLTCRSAGWSWAKLACACVAAAWLPALSAQISLTAAADLALRNNIKVKLAQDDVDRARAGLAEAHDIYIPTLNASSAGLGYAYGFPLGTPTLYSVNSQSLVYSAAQRDYIRASRDALIAANLALQEAREQVLEDVTVTYVALDRAQREYAVLEQELSFAERLEAIVKDRLDAGQDTGLTYTNSRRTRVRIQLQEITLEDEIDSDQDHLARLLGLAGTKVQTTPGGVPETSLQAAALKASQSTDSFTTPGLLSSFANAQSKMEQAKGDSKIAFWPIFSFGAQYSKFDTYNNAYVLYYPSVQGTPGHPLTSEAAGFAVNVSVPILDRGRKARANITQAEAVRAKHEAEQSRDTFLEGRLKLQHGMRELSLRAELAALDRDYAQQQLDAILVQMQEPPAGTAPATTPEDAANARINERRLFFDMLDARFQVDTAEINLLRQSGGLENWLKSAVAKP